MPIGGTGGGGGVSASAVKAGEAFFELGARDKFLKQALETNVKRVKAFAKEMQNIGLGMTAAGVGMLLPLTKASKAFASFDDNMRIVKAVTEGTVKSFQELTDLAMQLGEETSFTAVDVAGLMAELGKAGFSRNEIKDTTGAVLDLARATGRDAPSAADLLSTSLRNFKMDASEAREVADKLTVAVNASRIDMRELGDSFKYASQGSELAGVSFNELLSIIMTLGEAGIKGEQAGTSARRIMQTFIAQRDKIVELFGVDPFRNGQVRSPVDVLKDIGEATKNLPPAEKAQKFAEAFNILGITPAAALSENIDKIEEFIKKIEDAGGTANRQAKEMDAGIGGSFRRFWSTIEGTFIRVGNAIEEVVAPGLEIIRQIIKAIGGWIERNKELVTIITLVGTTLLVVGGTLAVAGFAITGITTTVTTLIVVLAKLKAALVVGFVPGLFVAAIGGAFALASEKAFGFLTEMKRLGGQVLSIFDTMFKGVLAAVAKGDFELAWKIIKQGWFATLAEMELSVTNMWVRIKDIMVGSFTRITEQLRDIWEDVTTAIAKGMIRAFGPAFGFKAEEIENILKQLKDMQEGEQVGRNINRQNTDRERDIFRQRQVENAQRAAREAMEELERLKKQAQAPPIGEPKPNALQNEQVSAMDNIGKSMERLTNAVQGAFFSGDFRGRLGMAEGNREAKKQTEKLGEINQGIEQANRNLDRIAQNGGMVFV